MSHKKVYSKVLIKELEKNLKEVEKISNNIAKERDKLSEIASDINDIVECLTNGQQYFEDALIEFTSGIEEISQYL